MRRSIKKTGGVPPSKKGEGGGKVRRNSVGGRRLHHCQDGLQVSQPPELVPPHRSELSGKLCRRRARRSPVCEEQERQSHQERETEAFFTFMQVAWLVLWGQVQSKLPGLRGQNNTFWWCRGVGQVSGCV